MALFILIFLKGKIVMKTWNKYVEEASHTSMLNKMKQYYHGDEKNPLPSVKAIVDYIKKSHLLGNHVIRFEGKSSSNASHVILVDNKNNIEIDSFQDEGKKTKIVDGEYIKDGEVWINNKMLGVKDFLKLFK